MLKLLFWRCAKIQNSLLPPRKSIIGAAGEISKLKNNNKNSAFGQGGITGARFTFLPETTKEKYCPNIYNNGHQDVGQQLLKKSKTNYVSQLCNCPKITNLQEFLDCSTGKGTQRRF